MYEYCINNKNPRYFKKIEDFSVATITARKGKYKRKISLLNTSWVKESETTILAEYEEKGTIGRAWYALQHYNFLFARYPGEVTDDEALEVWNRRLGIIRDFCEKNPKSDLTSVYNAFIEKTSDVNTQFSEFKSTHWKEWHHLAYVTISSCFFPIYEIIFDMRKGDSKPAFSPTEAISGLMGYVEMGSWQGMTEENIWIDPLIEVYNSIPTNEEGLILINDVFTKHFIAFYHLVTKRKLLTPSNMYASVSNLVPYMGINFSEWLMKGLLGY